MMRALVHIALWSGAARLHATKSSSLLRLGGLARSAIMSSAPSTTAVSLQPLDARPEIVVGQAVPADDSPLWVPQTDSVSFFPLCMCVSQGYYVNILRVKGGGGVLSRHRHTGPVHAHVLRGRWRYLEHEWEAGPGAYVHETPGETHTLVTLGDEEMLTLFHVSGALLYCDEAGNVQHAEDVFDKVAKMREHYAHIGLSDDYVQNLIR